MRHYRELGAGLRGARRRQGRGRPGLDQYLAPADTVDLIVDPAALVNHVLPYSQLFGPNGGGHRRAFRLALTALQATSTPRRSPWASRSAGRRSPRTPDTSAPTQIDDSHANAATNSKGPASAAARSSRAVGPPVTVFRCDMILADTSYTGQLNPPDMFTRLDAEPAATGIAPGSFYELDAHRQRAHYDGLPVEFVAEAILHPWDT